MKSMRINSLPFPDCGSRPPEDLSIVKFALGSSQNLLQLSESRDHCIHAVLPGRPGLKLEKRLGSQRPASHIIMGGMISISLTRLPMQACQHLPRCARGLLLSSMFDHVDHNGVVLEILFVAAVLILTFPFPPACQAQQDVRDTWRVCVIKCSI